MVLNSPVYESMIPVPDVVQHVPLQASLHPDCHVGKIMSRPQPMFARSERQA
jgi:hypothetical protein